MDEWSEEERESDLKIVAMADNAFSSLDVVIYRGGHTGYFIRVDKVAKERTYFGFSREELQRVLQEMDKPF